MLKINAWCSRSWTDIILNFVNLEVKHCCQASGEKFDIDNFFTQVNNSKGILQRREDSLKNIFHSQCDKCWNEYNLYGSARRDFWNEWESLNYFSPQWKNLQIHFDNICNLSCLYCNEFNSTRISNEKGLKVTSYFPKFKKQFYQWIDDQSLENRKISITGGEPSISNNVYQFLDYVANNRKEKFNLIIQTNCSVKNAALDRFISIIDKIYDGVHIILIISNESTSLSKYIRYGMDYNLFLSNLSNYVKNKKIKTIGFNPAVSCYSLKELPDYFSTVFKMIKDNNRKCFVHGNNVLEPYELSIDFLDIHNGKIIDKTIEIVNNNAEILLNYSEVILWLKTLYNKLNNENDIDRKRFLLKKTIEKNDDFLYQKLQKIK